jgi:hypothetical protein
VLSGLWTNYAKNKQIYRSLVFYSDFWLLAPDSFWLLLFVEADWIFGVILNILQIFLFFGADFCEIGGF